MKNNEHLVPVLITDLVNKLKTASTENERFNVELRLEAIRLYIGKALESLNKNEKRK